MKKKQYFFALLVASLAIFNSRPSQAVTLIYDSDSVDFSERDYVYETGGRYFVGKVKVETNITLSAGGTRGLKRLIQQKFPDWNIEVAPALPNDPFSFSSLNGQFQIFDYHPCPPISSPTCNTDPFAADLGATIKVDYIPGEGDPVQGRMGSATAPILQVGWIQRVKSNHPIAQGTYHGQIEDVLDQEINPFYSLFSNEIQTVRFRDTPSRDDAQRSHWWQAELYLATSVLGSKTITIYDGFRWGWSNTARRIDEPCGLCSDSGGNDTDNDPPPPSDPPVGLCSYSTEPDVRWPYDSEPSAASLSAPNSLAQEFSSRPSEVTAVPEPTSTVAVLAVGTWVGVSWRKRKSEKQLAEGNIT